MATDEFIRDSQNRVKDVFTKRPESALDTTYATAEITEGLTCTFTQGDVVAIMDMPEIMGGSNKGQSPGFHARAAIAGCVAIGIKQAAAADDIACEAIRVELEMDFDDAAMFGLGHNKASPLDTRLKIHITSASEPDIIEALVSRVLERDPYYLALRDAQSVSAHLHVDR